MKRKIFLFVLLFLFCGFFTKTTSLFCCAKTGEAGRVYEILVSGRILRFCETEILKDKIFLGVQREMIECRDKNSAISKLIKMGFSKKEAINYLFPETIFIEKKLAKILNKEETEDKIKVYKNECKIKIFSGEKGEFFDAVDFYEKLYICFVKNEQKIKLDFVVKKYKNKEIKKDDYCERGSFSTNFKNSSFERKNNIRVALEKFDGVILDEGEVLSFNAVTGERNESGGYMQAKIISGGTFVSGFGGGVCQVSTTLYNACLLAGLEILEVHNHSLPVSYVESSFDAMVNAGSSDLVIRNNTGGKIIITTSFLGDCCTVKIFGKENNFKIKRVSEKIKTLPAKIERVETDYKKFGLENLAVGEEKRISYAKDGFISKGYLEYYDERGNKVKTEKIRECKYNPTEGVVVRREN